MSKKTYFERQHEINEHAGLVKTAIVDPQMSGGQVIQDPVARAEAITNAALGSKLFEGLGDEKAIAGVATAWGASLKDYCTQHGGQFPREDLLASCAESAMALSNGDGSTAMFESAGGKANFTSSDGIDIRAKTMALILPVALSAATSDAATYVQGGRDEAEIFELHRVSATSFGDVEQGQRIEESFVEQFSGMKQIYKLPTQADGSKEKFAVYIYDEKTPITESNTLVSVIKNHNPKKAGFLPKSLRLRLNGRVIANSLAQGSLYGSFNYDGKDYTVAQESTNNAREGLMRFKISPALPANAGELTIQYDVDIEKGAANGNFPEISHEMDSFIITPHQSVLASQHTIQSYWALNREYGMDVRSMQVNTMRNLTAYEKDIRNLRDMLLATKASLPTEIELKVSGDTYFKERYEEIKEHLLLLSQIMLTETKVSGLVGLYARTGFTAVLKALGRDFFVPAPNYKQVNRVHFCGTLFGMWKVYEVPHDIEIAGVKLTANDAIGYARGDNFAQAGLLAGNAVSPTLYRHSTDAKLFNRDTVWELSFGDISPRDGEKFFRKISLTKS